jgi:hypothetical protein
MPEKSADERVFEMITRMAEDRNSAVTLEQFKQIVREQFFMLLIDERRAVETIPQLLKGHEDEMAKCLEDIRKVATAPGPLGKESEQRLAEITKLFTPPKPKPKPKTNSKQTKS